MMHPKDCSSSLYTLALLLNRHMAMHGTLKTDMQICNLGVDP